MFESRGSRWARGGDEALFQAESCLPSSACHWIPATDADVRRDAMVGRYRALLARPMGTQVDELHNGRMWRLRVVGKAQSPGLTTFAKDVRGWLCQRPDTTAELEQPFCSPDLTITVHLTDGDVGSTRVDGASQEHDWSKDQVFFLSAAPPPRIATASPSPIQSSSTGTAQLTDTAEAWKVVQVLRQGVHSQPIVWSMTSPATRPLLVDHGDHVDVELGARARVSTWLSAGDIGMARTPSRADRDRSRISPAWRIGYRGLDDVSFLATVVPKLDANGVAYGDFDWANNFVAGDARAFLLEAIQMLHRQKVQVFVTLYLDSGVAYNRRFTAGMVKYLRATAGRETDLAVLRPRFAPFAQRLLQFFDSAPDPLDIDGICFDLETGEPNGAADRPAVQALYQVLADELAKKGRYLVFAASGAEKVNMFTREQPYALAAYPNVIVRPMSYDVGRNNLEVNTTRYALDTVGLHPGKLQIGTDGLPGSSANEQLALAHRKYRTGMFHFNLGNQGTAAANQRNVDGYMKWDAALNPGLPPAGTLGQPLQGPLDAQRIAAMRAAGASWPTPQFLGDGSHWTQRG